MFGRLLWRLLQGSRGRLIIALVALISGGAVISSLLNLDLDASRKLTREFRRFGANLVVTPQRGFAAPQSAAGASIPGSEIAGSGAPALMDQNAAMAGIEAARAPEFVAAAPFLYVTARSAGTDVVVAGAWLDEMPQIAPAWKIEGQGISARDDLAHCMIGHNVASQLHLAPGAALELDYMQRSVRLAIAGVVEAGGAEDNQVFVNLPVAQRLAALPGRIQLVEITAAGNARAISGYAARLAQALPGYQVRPIRQMAQAEGDLLARIQSLIVWMVALILALTALCVLATMSALAMERRNDVGLMKALGGSISRIVGLFLAEIGVLGAAGGIIGAAAGIALSRWMGQRVFHAPISARWEVFPLTIALMIGISLAAALPLRMLGKIKPAVILRGE
ncbi:MAG TPA: ABC transporter permease [Candidatus Acidoferrales bacterium]|nr:ABC transporter permease [Candidatus Acidoferrales bacterium]